MRQYEKQYVDGIVAEAEFILRDLMKELKSNKISVNNLLYAIESFPCDVYEITNNKDAQVYLQLTSPPRPIFYFKKDDLHTYTSDIKEIKQFLLEETTNPVSTQH